MQHRVPALEDFPDNKISIKAVELEALRHIKKFNLQGLVYDPWQFERSVEELAPFVTMIPCEFSSPKAMTLMATRLLGRFSKHEVELRRRTLDEGFG